MGTPTSADLNRLYDASLEFGPNWRRPIPELAAERLTHLSLDEQAEISALVGECRGAVEDQVAKVHHEVGGDWTTALVDEVEEWITARFPWVDADNRSHAISQGQYYAWHG